VVLQKYLVFLANKIVLVQTGTKNLTKSTCTRASHSKEAQQ